MLLRPRIRAAVPAAMMNVGKSSVERAEIRAYSYGMYETQRRDTLESLAHYVVRNEIVCEHFLTQKLPVSREEIAAKVRAVDEHLKTNTEWQHNRFPGLFAC